MKCLWQGIIGFCLTGLITIGLAQQAANTIQNPVNFVQNTVQALQSELKGGDLANDPTALFAVIKKTVIPYVDVNEMAGLALGPRWRQATPAQQQQFIDQFGLLLTRTYADALLTVNNYNITIYPLRSNAWQTAQTISVNGIVTSKSNDQSSHLTYYLERSGNSWKIYDLAVEGVSFMKNYQAQFQAFDDMPTLLSKLKSLNTES